MIRRNSKARFRALRTFLILLFVVLAFLAGVMWLHKDGIRQEVAKAQAILDRLHPDAAVPSNTAKPANPPQGVQGTRTPPLPASSPPPLTPEDAKIVDAAKCVEAELPRIVLTLIDCLLEKPGAQQDNVLQVLGQRLAQDALTRQLTPLEDSLNPSTHSRDEISAAICGLLRQSRAVESAKAAVETTPPFSRQRRGRDYWNAHDTVHDIISTCSICDKMDGNAEAAAWDLLRELRLSSPNYYPTLHPRLAEVLDLFPGAVPEPIAMKMIARMNEDADLELTRNLVLEKAAIEVKNNADYHSTVLQDAGFHGYVVACLMPREQNMLVLLSRRNPAHKLLERVEDVLPLLERPPYLTSTQFDAAIKAVPSDATATKEMLNSVRNAAKSRYCLVALAEILKTVFALKTYKGEHGQYPASLDGLTPAPIPELPLNPVTGRPMTYAQNGDGFDITDPPQDKPEGQAEAEPHRNRVPVTYFYPQWHAKK